MAMPADGLSNKQRSSPSFRAAAGEELFAALEAEQQVVYALDRQMVVQFVNPAWERFALANNGRRCVEEYGIGRSMRDAVPDVLWPFYEVAFASAFAFGLPWNHEYECSTPTRRRLFRMRAARLLDGSHVVVANDPIREASAERAGDIAIDYVTADGLVVQCAHCRRCRRVGTQIWDWVPHYIETPFERVSHGLCPTCFVYHYPL